LWLLLPLLLIALIWRAYNAHPTQAADRQAEEDGKLLIWYRALTQLLGARGLTLDPAETPLAFFERAERALANETAAKNRGGKGSANGGDRCSPVPLIPIAGAVCSLRYGAHGLEPGALDRAFDAYSALWRMLTPPQKIRVLWRRTLYGVGNIKQVP